MTKRIELLKKLSLSSVTVYEVVKSWNRRAVSQKQNKQQIYNFKMVSRTYEMKLSNHKIFKDLSASLKENPTGKLRNLLEFRDDVLYVWNSIENCLMSLNLKHLEENDEETPYQVSFSISDLLFSTFQQLF